MDERILTVAQQARRATMRSRVLERLELLSEEARASAFTIGERVPQPIEVRRLQRRLRAVSARWSPVWTSPTAANATDIPKHLEHVVPVVVLTERVLQGDPVEAVLAQSVVCWVSYQEHKEILEVSFRRVHAELYQRMLSRPLKELSALGWERYRLVGLNDCYPLAP